MTYTWKLVKDWGGTEYWIRIFKFINLIKEDE